MSRTEQQIIDAMGTPPDGLTFEATADSTRWRNIFAQAIKIFEDIFDQHVVDVETEIQNNRYGSQRWWRSAAVAYQHGDSLALDLNGVPRYDVVDTTKQIIVAVSARESVFFGTLTITLKVAKLVSNVLTPLSTEELAGFRAYVNYIRPFGVRVEIISTSSDLIQLTGNVYLSSLIGVNTVETAIKLALKTYRVFDAVAKKSDFTKTIANINGVFSVGDFTFRHKSYVSSVYVDAINATLDAGYFNYGVLSLNLIDVNNNVVKTITTL